LAVDIALLAYEKKCEDIVILDMRGLTTLCDYFVVLTANSQSHMNTLRETVLEQFSKESGTGNLYNRNVSPSWQVLDYVNVVVHLMTPAAREFYRLERLWGKAKEINWHDKTGNKGRTLKKA
jgi:ribosome-associated protein